MRKKIFFKILIISIFIPWTMDYGLWTAFAESSVNVPLRHWAYDALQTLNKSGLSDGSGLTTRPITRISAARLVQEAITRIQKEKVQFSVFDENRIKRSEDALDRLVEEFRQELLHLGVSVAAKKDEKPRSFRFRLGDPIYSQTVYADLKKTDDLLHENQRGLHLKNGFNYRTRLASWIEINDFLAVEIEPVVILSDDGREFDIETGYAKLSFQNIELEAGRDTIWWGPGYHGSMLLSDNAYPFKMVKIGSAHPFVLPGKYESLGKWNVDFFVARLENKRAYPHARLTGLRIEYAPCDYFNIGLSRTALFGGKGRPHLDLNDYWDMFTAFGKNELSQDPNKNISDQKASVDFTFNIPWHDRPFGFCTNMQFYGEWAGEDKFAPWENESPGYLGGILVSDIFKVRGLDFRTEYSRTDASWYTHGIYETGYSHKEDIIGHHMGGDADDLFIRLSKRFTEHPEYFQHFILGCQFDRESHGRSLAYPERKYEAAIDGVFYLSDSKAVKLIYERQEYKNFANISGNKIHNNIFEVEGKVKF